jgi:hypothetical protein
MSIRFAIFALGALAASACATFPPERADVVRASDLIDNVKAQLAKVSINPVVGPGGVCSNTDKQVAIVAIPTAATVSLKAVTTVATSGSGGGTFPVLSIPVGPSFTYTNTRATTQIVTFELNIVHDPKTEADLTNEVKTLRTKIDANTATLKDLDKRLTQKQIDFLDKQIKTDTAIVAADEATILTMHMSKDYVDASILNEDFGSSPAATAAPSVPSALVSRTEPVKKDMTIAEAVSAAAEELLKVNHNLKPCLKPQTVKVEIDFDVQKKKDGSLSITVVVWKFGTERIATSEQYHSIVVTFDLTQGSPILAN